MNLDVASAGCNWCRKCAADCAQSVVSEEEKYSDALWKALHLPRLSHWLAGASQLLLSLAARDFTPALWRDCGLISLAQRTSWFSAITHDAKAQVSIAQLFGASGFFLRSADELAWTSADSPQPANTRTPSFERFYPTRLSAVGPDFENAGWDLLRARSRATR
jgi:hypothetical protein